MTVKGNTIKEATNRKILRTKEDFLEAAKTLHGEATSHTTTSWTKWSPDPAAAYPKYRDAGDGVGGRRVAVELFSIIITYLPYPLALFPFSQLNFTRMRESFTLLSSAICGPLNSRWR